MQRVSKSVVASVFVALGLSFIATTAVLYWEFKDDNWFTIAAFYSHLFIFFPTFGILALFAFYVPAWTLLDLYLTQVRYGKLRLVAGTAALLVISILISSMLVTGVPAIWWLKPATLDVDIGSAEGCGKPQCARVAVMESVAEVRRVAQMRMGLSPFARSCDIDPLVEVPAEQTLKRYCFVTKTKLGAAECCQAQQVFTRDLTSLYAQEPTHSLTGRVHAILLPLKIFFLLVILAIGLLLALWRRSIDKLYAACTKPIERGLMIGAIAMLVWPIANHGFLQSSMLLYGKAGEGIYASMSPALSAFFAAWALLLVVFFFRQHERDIEAAGKIGGGLASAVAILKYNEIIDYSTRFIGSGIGTPELIAIAILIVMALTALLLGLGDRGAPLDDALVKKKTAGERS